MSKSKVKNEEIENKVVETIEEVDDTLKTENTDEVITSDVKNEEIENNNDISDNEVTSKKYIVVYPFLDLNDKKHKYDLNKTYPREDMTDEELKNALSEERIHQLTTNENKIGQILIKELED